jgi:hypothetical protein
MVLFTRVEDQELRSRGERTVRQQALAVYRKSKLSGRARNSSAHSIPT